MEMYRLYKEKNGRDREFICEVPDEVEAKDLMMLDFGENMGRDNVMWYNLEILKEFELLDESGNEPDWYRGEGFYDVAKDYEFIWDGEEDSYFYDSCQYWFEEV